MGVAPGVETRLCSGGDNSGQGAKEPQMGRAWQSFIQETERERVLGNS